MASIVLGFFSDLPDTSGKFGVDKHLRIEVNTIVPFRILNDFEGKIAILLVRRVDLHKYEIIDLNGKCSFVAHYQGQNNPTIYKKISLLGELEAHAAILDYVKDAQILLTFNMLSKSRQSSKSYVR